MQHGDPSVDAELDIPYLHRLATNRWEALREHDQDDESDGEDQGGAETIDTHPVGDLAEHGRWKLSLIHI